MATNKIDQEHALYPRPERRGLTAFSGKQSLSTENTLMSSRRLSSIPKVTVIFASVCVGALVFCPSIARRRFCSGVFSIISRVITDAFINFARETPSFRLGGDIRLLFSHPLKLSYLRLLDIPVTIVTSD